MRGPRREERRIGRIVTRIAEMHGGTLVIGPRSDGPGTEAVITLPLEGPAKAMRPLP